MKKNILLNLEAVYNCDWRSAIDETYELSKEMNIGCMLKVTSTKSGFNNEYSFRIVPTMTQEEINELKCLNKLHVSY